MKPMSSYSQFFLSTQSQCDCCDLCGKDLMTDTSQLDEMQYETFKNNDSHCIPKKGILKSYIDKIKHSKLEVLEGQRKLALSVNSVKSRNVRKF